ncbi:hypothetical protein [uncultured Jatrophihabitans sp.]|uniref:hypothetical protein n=1 Tax=uncultured Jatrophihabitans sp. TaxID=1610747 RepID=UPI0035CA5B31
MNGALPLIDLHRHLEGSIRTSTVLEIARRTGHPLASLADPRAALVADEPLPGLLPYLPKVDVAESAQTTEQDWARSAQSPRESR